MGVREEARNLIRSGFSPKEIAQQRGVSLKTILGYLDQLVGQGNIRRSDILFSIPKNIRKAITEEPEKGSIWVIDVELREKGVSVDREDIEVVLKYGDSRHAMGDMYDDLRSIEVFLHDLIRKGLEEEYGKGELNWWKKGVGETTRINCQAKREKDINPLVDPYCYTDLLDLWKILDNQWKVLNGLLPTKLTKDKKSLGRKLTKINEIRNNVMHPVRGIIPSEEDFEFIRDLKRELEIQAFNDPMFEFEYE